MNNGVGRQQWKVEKRLSNGYYVVLIAGYETREAAELKRDKWNAEDNTAPYRVAQWTRTEVVE